MNQKTKKSLATGLRLLRVEVGITQREAAEKAGVNELTVRRIESGVSLPSMKYLCSLATILGKRPSQILARIGL